MLSRPVPSPAALAAHVRDLAAAFGVRLLVDPTLAPDAAGAGMNRLTGEDFVLIPAVTEETSYAVALHELGHRVAPTGNLHAERSPAMRLTGQPACTRDMRLQLDTETAAWDWAKHHALAWTPLMARVRAMTFRTYLQKARAYGIVVIRRTQ